MNKKQDEEMELYRELIKHFKAILDLLPPLEPTKTEILLPQEECACGKLVSTDQLEELDTGVKRILNNVCKGCISGKKHDRETSRIVCVKCSRVICRVTPGKDKDGFLFKPNHTYHVATCGFCNPGEDGTFKAYPIIEKKLWKRKRGK